MAKGVFFLGTLSKLGLPNSQVYLISVRFKLLMSSSGNSTFGFQAQLGENAAVQGPCHKGSKDSRGRGAE